MQLFSSLAHVAVYSSCVLPLNLEEVWEEIRKFGSISDWLPEFGGDRVQSSLLPGHHEHAVGSTRLVAFGASKQVCEQMVCLDDEKHILKYKVISHPMNRNPFPASFVNFISTIQLHPVTVGDQTFMQWSGVFFTEPEVAAQMHSDLKARMETGFQGLYSLLSMRQRHHQLFAKVQPHTPWASSPDSMDPTSPAFTIVPSKVEINLQRVSGGSMSDSGDSTQSGGYENNCR